MRILSILGLVVLFAGGLAAQTAIHSGPSRVFHVYVGPQTFVRDQAGYLYTAYADRIQSTPSARFDVFIGRSTDGGKSWNMKWQSGFAYNTGTDYGNRIPSLAIDDQGNLHCSWYHQVSSTSNMSVRYNRWDAQKNAWGTEQTMVASGYKRSVQALAVDAQNTVWMLCSNTGSYSLDVKRSDKPYASDMKFSNASPAFTHSGTCQYPDLIVDAAGRIHVSYYSTSNGATVHHQWLDPGAASPKWSAALPLGNSNGTADYYSSMAADLAGNVYVVYSVDGQRNKTHDPEWFLRKWDGSTQTWSGAVSIYKTTRKQYEPTSSTYNDDRVFSAACDETTGEVYFVYRNFESGELLLGRWHDGDAAPTDYAKLMNTGSLPVNSRNYFIFPQFRGSIFPSFNRASGGLDLVYTVGDQNAPSPMYNLFYEHFPVGSLSSTGTPKIGTSYTLDLSAVMDANKAYLLALSMTDIQPGIPIARRFIPLAADSMFFLTAMNLIPVMFQQFQGVLSGAGAAQAKIAIPNMPALVNIKIYGAFITYPGAAGVNAISNPFTFVITS